MGNVSRYTLVLMAPFNPNLRLCLAICDKSFKGKGYYLLDVINTIKALKAKLCLVVLFVLKTKYRLRTKTTTKICTPSVKRKRDLHHAHPEGDERPRTSRKTRI